MLPVIENLWNSLGIGSHWPSHKKGRNPLIGLKTRKTNEHRQDGSGSSSEKYARLKAIHIPYRGSIKYKVAILSPTEKTLLLELVSKEACEIS